MEPHNTDLAATLFGKIRARQTQIGILGLGYVGLPLARAFAVAGFPVVGFDIDPTRVTSGKSYNLSLSELVSARVEISFSPLAPNVRTRGTRRTQLRPSPRWSADSTRAASN